MVIFDFLAKSGMLVTSLWAVGESYTLPVFFPVEHNLNRSTCRCDFFGNVYFRFGERPKIGRTRVCTFLSHFGPGRYAPTPGVGIG